MKNIIRSYKDRAIAWLDRQLDAHRLKNEAVKLIAMIDPTATLLPEASILNPVGKPELVKIGANSLVLGRLVVFSHGGTIEIGNFCYIGHRSEIWSMDKVCIGSRVVIAHDVNISDTSAHSANHLERAAQWIATRTSGAPKTAAELPGIKTSPIHIEDDVWISFGVTILRGVTIGARSIIAAGTIVTKDVPPDTSYRNDLGGIATPIERWR